MSPFNLIGWIRRLCSKSLYNCGSCTVGRVYFTKTEKQLNGIAYIYTCDSCGKVYVSEDPL